MTKNKNKNKKLLPFTHLFDHDREQNASDGDANHKRREDKTGWKISVRNNALQGGHPHKNCRGGHRRDPGGGEGGEVR